MQRQAIAGEANEQVVLYVCWGTFGHPFGHLHPCERAYAALKQAGHDPLVIKSYGLRHLPDPVFNRSSGRRRSKELTGTVMVPVLITADGQIINESERIAEWARHNPAPAQPEAGTALAVSHHTAEGVERDRVLLVHGAWHASWVWENWIRTLTGAGYGVYTVDLRGHGASPGSVHETGLSDYVNDVRGVVEACGDPILVGHSLGGLIIEYLLAERPYRAASLVAAVPPRYPLRILVRNAVRHPIATSRGMLRRDLRALVETPELLREAFFNPATAQESIEACLERVGPASPRLFREMIAQTPGPPSGATPTLVLAGELDPGLTPAIQRRLAARYDARFELVAGCGHDLMLDSGWAAGAEVFTGWLDDVAAPAPVQPEAISRPALHALVDDPNYRPEHPERKPHVTDRRERSDPNRRRR